MKKLVLLSITLSSLLCLMMLFPENESSAILDNTINLNSCTGDIYITKAGEYLVTGDSKDVSIIVIAPKCDVSLTLSNANMTSQYGPCIIVEKAQSACLNFGENSQNSLTTTNNSQFREYTATVYSRDNLILDGTGNVTIRCDVGHGIKGNDSVDILNSNCKIQSTEDCIHVNDNLKIMDGTFILDAGDKGLRAEQEIAIIDGVFDIQSSGDAIRAETLLTIHDGAYTINSDAEGLESKTKIIINDGFLLVHSKDDGINATSEIEINGGDIRVISSGNDAIDSNGMITINGGKIYASGFKSPEGAIDCDMGLLQINGGQIMGIGRMNSYYNVGNQNILLINPEEELYIRNIKIMQFNEIVFEHFLHEYDETQELSMGMKLPSPITSPFTQNTNLLGSSVSLFVSFPELKEGMYSVYFNDIFYSNVEISEKYTILGEEPVLRFPK